MPKGPPKFLWIAHDDYHAEHIGSTADNRQFLLTTPFVPAIGDNPGCEFIAVYFFDANGKFLEAKIDDLGIRGQLDSAQRSALYQTRLAELGEVTFGNIKIAPFRIEKFGVEFGLIPRAPEDKDDHWWVILMPGDYMAFYPPWDGEYDT